jgi:FkbM family methyltransferase
MNVSNDELKETIVANEFTKTSTLMLTEKGIFTGLSNDAIVRMLHTNGDYEPHVVELFNKLIGPGDSVMDIGASIGYHTVQLSRLVGNSGNVIAVEPQKIIHNFLCANLVLNSCFNVSTIQKALGNGTGYLTLSKIDYSDRSLNSGCQRIGTGGEQVEQITLDSIPVSKPLRFIKIDAQGAEPYIIVGAMGTLTSADRPVICFEVEDIWLRALGSSTNQLLNILLGLNYVILRIRSEYPCDHLAVPIEQWNIVNEKLINYSLSWDLIHGRSVSVQLFDNNLYSSFVVT